MTKNIQIEMVSGSKIALVELTQADLPNIKLTEKDGETNLTMKTEVISETATHALTRRLYKWTTMPVIAMYDIAVPKTFAAWKAGTTEEAMLEYGIGNWLIEQDKNHNGVSSGISKEGKEMAKLVGRASADIQAQIRALLLQVGVKAEEVPEKTEAMKKNLKSHGFGK